MGGGGGLWGESEKKNLKGDFFQVKVFDGRGVVVDKGVSMAVF